ncbi:MAG TPA: OsmC family protein [Brevefilum sp.]|nr:OsmC family protein [Brevefilum sp.]HOR18999.1 OsmC family protein [Brevefilum sp.]HPL69322.1 OsmC family protein [Brevefilum sp.]
MMIKRTAKAVWQGDLKQGSGSLELGSGAFQGKYSFSSRFEDGVGTNPEELIGAAHAGCFSMALSLELSKAGYTVDEIQTEAIVSLDKDANGFSISGIKLVSKARVKDITMDEFIKYASGAKENCPVSKALAGVKIYLEAHLIK